MSSGTAPRNAADIQVCEMSGKVTLSIADDGRRESETYPVRSDRAGYGLSGLRERLAQVGGELDAGPEHGQGFRLLATIPIGPANTVAPEIAMPPASQRLAVELPR